jgi:hypothetical protein
MAPEAPEEKYEYWISVEKRYKQEVTHILGYSHAMSDLTSKANRL